MRPERGHVTYFWNFRTPSISRELLELETSWRADSWRVNEINKIMLKGSRRGHVNYFWNFGTPPYLGNEVVITRAILSKFGFKRDLNIAKRVLLLNPTPGWISNSIWPQFFNCHKSIWRHNFAVRSFVWMTFGRHMLNHVEKQQLVKKLSSLKRLLRTTSATRRSKTANITKNDITSQHSDIYLLQSC